MPDAARARLGTSCPMTRSPRTSSQTLQHVGEWKVELRADTIEELFVELARTLAHAAGPVSTPRGPGAWEHVELEARDRVALLVDWGNELIGRSEVGGRAYGDVKHLVVESEPTSPARLVADVRGQPVEEWISPVKAATYHGATVERQGSGWRAVVLFDV